jgi:hypothetical protein
MIKQVKESELEKYLSPEGMKKHGQYRKAKREKTRQTKTRRQGVFYPLPGP